MSISRIAIQCAQLLEENNLDKTSPLEIRAGLGEILARFKIWAGNVGVFAPGNASIEYRLRDDNDIADLLSRLLGRLKKHLEQAVRPPLTEESDDEHEQLDSSASSISSDSSSELDLDSDEAASVPDIEVGDQSRDDPITQANSTMDYLYRLSVLLKKPVSSTENDKVRRFIAKPPDEETAEEQSDFESHVRWMIEVRHFPTAPKELIDRLVTTVVFRRMKLLYRQRHRDKLGQGFPHSLNAQPVSEDMLIGERSHPFGISGRESSRPTTWKSQSHSFSATTASSVNRSRYPNFPNSVALSRITQTAVARRGKLDVPKPPHDADGRVENLLCPYCFRFLEKEERHEPRWTRHILKDIEPYVCLFKDCTEGNAMFQSADEWLKHMQWQHTIVWCCQAPGHELDIFNSQVGLENHIRLDHPSAFTESQLPMLIQRGRRPAADTFGALVYSFGSDGPSGNLNQCPLCNKFQRELESGDRETQNVEALPKIQDHILEHMETIALLSLPEEDQHDSKSDTLELRSRETVKLGTIDLPSPTFEENTSTQTSENLRQDFPLDFEYANIHILTPSPLEHAEQWSTICQTIQDQRELKDPLAFPQPDSDLILSHWKENAHTPSGMIDLALKYRNSESPESPPSPFNNIPFCRNPGFVGRGALLDQIRKKCCVPAARVALVGLGGIGKSQLAIEYCYRIRDESPETWVFWVCASNEARFREAYRTIADGLRLPERNNPMADVLKLVCDWLSDATNGRWVMVLEDVDNPEFFYRNLQHTNSEMLYASDNATTSLSDYLPQGCVGSILVTSRNVDGAIRLTGGHKNIIAVPPPSTDQGLQLLRNKLEDVPDEHHALELLRALEHSPLAIIQATAFIHQCAISISNYLDLLNKKLGDFRQYTDVPSSILTTFQISFEHIREERQSAADLLALMSFFNPEGIPRLLLRKYSSGAADEFENDLDMLKSYSVVTETNGEMLEMHRLVQLSTRKWLELVNQLENGKRKFLAMMAREFPSGESKNWAKCEALFPHIESIAGDEPIGIDLAADWALILTNAASYAWARGDYGIAENMAARATTANERVEGQEGFATLISMGILASVLHAQGKYKESEEMSRQALTGSEKALGKEHPQTLTTMANLAVTYKDQGRWKEAEELQVQVMETSTRVLGAEHPRMLSTMANLASTYWNQGRWKDAEVLEMQVMETSTRVLGPEHPDTLNGMASLAVTYSGQGRWKAAEELEVQVMETSTRVLGPEHPRTLNRMASLAATYMNQKRWKEAEELEVQVLETSTRVLGPEHPRTLNGMASLAATYMNQKRWKEAEELEVQVIKTSTRVLGPEHPDTLIRMTSLAVTYSGQGRWKAAEELLVQVMETSTRVLGPEHPDTLNCMANLAATYRNQGRWKEAEELEVQVMETSSRVLGPEHPDTLNNMACLALIFKCQGRNDEAISLLEECVQLQHKIIGPEHPYTVASYEYLQAWRLENTVPESKTDPNK